MDERPSKWVSIPNEIITDTRLSFFEKVLWGEIQSLERHGVPCFAGNQHFEETFSCEKATVSRAISHLALLNYLLITYSNESTKTGRTLTTLCSTGQTPFDEKVKGFDEKVKEEDINNNISSLRSDILRPSPSKPQKTPNPEVNVVRDYFCEQFKKFTNQEVTWQFARDGKMVKDLLAVHPIEEVKDHINKFFSIRDAFIEKAGRRFPIFYSQYDKISSMGPMYVDDFEQDYWTIHSLVPGSWYTHNDWLDKYYMTANIKNRTKNFTDYSLYSDQLDKDGVPKRDSYVEWSLRWRTSIQKRYPKVWADLEKRVRSGEFPDNSSDERKKQYKQILNDYES